MGKSSDILEELLLDDSFVAWVQEEGDKHERAYWNAWFKEDSHHKELVSQARKFLSLPYNDVKRPDIDLELTYLNQAIEQRAVMHELASYRSPRQPSQLGWLYAGAIATVAACVVIVFLLLSRPDKSTDSIFSQYKTLATSYGEKATLKLKDGTKIIVNAHSELRYPKIINITGPLDVWLTGEAYFNVKKNPGGGERVFTVHTEDGIIRVLGTHFVVQKRHQGTQVVLEKGSVRVSLKDKAADKEKSLTMVPGELSYFSRKGDTIGVRKVNTAVYTSWIDNKIVLDGTPVKDLVERIEQDYGVTIKVDDKKILDKKLSGTMEDFNLTIIKKGLSQILNVEVIQHDKVIEIKAN